MASEMNINYKKRTSLNLALDNKTQLSLQTATPVGGTSDYERLKNIPQINGEQVRGNKTTIDYHIVSENTTRGWDENPLYIPRAGEIIVYTDASSYVDDQGVESVCPNVKIGDGSVPVVDLPFVNGNLKNEIIEILNGHINDQIIHVSAQDRARWDAKLNYDVHGETLIFTRN